MFAPGMWEAPQVPNPESRSLARLSHTPVYCIGAMIRPDCVAFVRPPQRTVQYASGGLHSCALSGRPCRRFVTTWCEKVGLERPLQDRGRWPKGARTCAPTLLFVERGTWNALGEDQRL